MTSMIERVAKALSPYAWAPYWKDEYKSKMQESAFAQARAAIEAMREISPAMIEIGANAGEMYGNTNAEATWQAIIDAALSDTAP